jgi:UDP-GlcNAc:undecaprenyl-phosphate/decaprenyl-phosphate GlcNAc-1-phosphate transferase
MWIIIIFAALFITELIYFRVADHFNIIDYPNERSSHKRVTLRGGGIIFSLGVLAFFLTNNFQYPFFMMGLAAITAISFADDVRPQSNKLRIAIHFAAVAAMMYQLNLFSYPLHWWLLAFILIIGIINAYNFMDGINGITTAYSFTILAALYFINMQLKVLNDNLIICLALANLVFAFFNFRKKAKCFAGDVGSVSMAFSVLFLTTAVIHNAGTIFFILLFAVYGVDSVLTITHRLIKRENIFKAHRQHLFQYLANEKKWPHLAVSSLYMLLQGAISTGVVLLWQKQPQVQWMYGISVLGVLAITYIVVKWRILRQVQNNSGVS